jgi:hypothetical protein
LQKDCNYVIPIGNESPSGHFGGYMIINYQRLQEVKELYEQGNRTKKFFMNKYNISNKTVQRIFKKLGFIAEHKQHTKYRLSYDLAITDYKNGMLLFNC